MKLVPVRRRVARIRNSHVPLFLHSLWILVLLGSDPLTPSSRAASLPTDFVETSIPGTWNQFVGIVFDEIGTFYAWDRQGRVWIVDDENSVPTLVLDISEEVGSWSDHGMIGFALHPNFRQNGYMYLMYVVDHHHLTKFGTLNYSATANEYNQATIGRITRYTARASDNFHTVDPASRNVLLGDSPTNGIPILYVTHGVGSLVFASDGTLLASAGDGAGLGDFGSQPESYYVQALNEGIIRPKENVGAYRCQMVDSLNGKILRLDPDTGDGVPSNPFFDPINPRAPRSRVWSLGLRNPYRIKLRPETGSHNANEGNPGVIYIGDVGYFTWEELSVATGPGMNFGWPVYEGYTPVTLYLLNDMPNPDAPNPLYGIGGCTQQYFTFQNLLTEASLSPPSWPNPCNPAQQIPASIPRFVHSRPVMDWMHGSGPSRHGIFVNGQASVTNIGGPGSNISGPQFGGNCSTAGAWYEEGPFPEDYHNTYFHADFGSGWIHNLTFDSSNNLVSVRPFASGAGGVTCIAIHPTNGALYYVGFWEALRKIAYVPSGNQPPTAVATSDLTYGLGPLTVQFNGSGSFDPQGQALTYRWNFGDGSSTSTATNPVHVFNAPSGVPTRYDVTLTVTDSGGASNTTTRIISVNNTPPHVTITSPVNGTLYPMTGQTVYNLTATVTDTEHAQAQLSPQWQTALHHNNHDHPDPLNTNWTTTATVSPAGCDGDTYYYRITLTVTDAAGLSASDTVLLYPNCSAPVISSIPNQTTNEDIPAGPLPFTVSDGETPVSGLTLSGSSDNTLLIPNANIAFSGSGSNRTVTITPMANKFGSANITITVNDRSTNSSTSFLITVNAVNDPPSLSTVLNQTIDEDASTGPIALTVTDVDNDAGSLTLSGSSSNPALVPNSNIVFGGSGSNRTVTVTPVPQKSGTPTITIQASDGTLSSSNAFVLTINPVNDPPWTTNDILVRLSQEGIKVSSSVLLTNDLDPEGDLLTLTSVSPVSAAGGAVSRTGKWVRYTPPPGLTTNDTFTYTASDGNGGTATGLVTVQTGTSQAQTANLITLAQPDGSVLIRGRGLPGRTYRVQYTEDLQNPNWQTLTTVTASTTGAFQFIDTPPPEFPTRFYRAIHP